MLLLIVGYDLGMFWVGSGCETGAKTLLLSISPRPFQRRQESNMSHTLECFLGPLVAVMFVYHLVLVVFERGPDSNTCQAS